MCGRSLTENLSVFELKETKNVQFQKLTLSQLLCTMYCS